MIKTHHTIGDDAIDFDFSTDPSTDVFIFSNSAASPVELPTIGPKNDAAGEIVASLGSSGTTSIVSGTSTMDVATFAGSGIVFNNTYTANVTQTYKNDILAAEQDIASHWSNSITINLKFDAQAEGQNGNLASNSFGLVEGISYSALKAALIAHDSSNPDAQAAVNSLPSVDPSGGVGWSLPVAYARMLGLTTFTPTTDDTVTLNTSYAWNYTQDVIGTIEHEMTEGGMGRIGALGKNFDNLGNALWSTMDLFRYSAAGVRDYTDGQDGKATYFSVDGSQLLLQFNNQYNGATQVNGGDTADYNALDVFGFGSPGTGLTLSTTDLKNMNVLGWTPTNSDTVPPMLVADTALVVATGLTATITTSQLRFDDSVSTHAQETYSVVTSPAHGSLRKNGLITSSFTQADIDNGLITYQESGNFSSDSFAFNVTDNAGNTTTTQQFHFQIGNPVVVESFGSTYLTEIVNHFFLYDSGGSGPSLKYAGADIIAGQVGGWAPIGAEITAGGYEVAWKLAGADQYSIWTTDSSGNWTAFVTGAVSGSSSALQNYETSFHQDLNGDGSIGPPPAASGTVIESSGSTYLTEVGNNYDLYNSGGAGPSLKYGGAAIVAGQVGGWAPIGAEITSGGYEVAWKLTGADQYSIWTTDSNGNWTAFVTGAVSGSSSALENYETSFHQDLNGDGFVGPPGSTVIESSGSTYLNDIGNHYYLYNSSGVGPTLKYGGADIIAGQVGGWAAIGAEATAGGYEVAWKLAGADQYSIWTADNNGNWTSFVTGAVSGTSNALETFETSFHQDLNGDGVVGLPSINQGTSAAPTNNVLVMNPQGSILTGGAGNETFVFNFPVNSPSTITDFASGQDLLQISADAFGHGLTAGAIPTMVTGAPADVSHVGSSGYFIFDNTDPHGGTLYWDATGGNGADATALVHLQGVNLLHPSDLHLV